ncbi:MAG: archaetidylserine decarboxylase [Vicinamibacteria bacterium]
MWPALCPVFVRGLVFDLAPVFVRVAGFFRDPAFTVAFVAALFVRDALGNWPLFLAKRRTLASHAGRTRGDRGPPRWLESLLMTAWRRAAERAFATAVSLPLLSRLAGWLADLRLPSPILAPAIRAWSRLYGADLSEAAEPIEAFRTFNAFFTRALRDGARPIETGPGVVVSPSDSRLSGIGTVPADGRLEQVKGQDYPLEALLGSPEEAEPYRSGLHATLYLGPGMYHRVHAPVDGSIVGWRYVPGRLFPVNPPAVRSVPGLFTRNERVVLFLEAEELGPVAIVLVGATNVGRITLRFTALATNAGAAPVRAEPPEPIGVRRGDELGVFNLGSTVVLLVADATMAPAGVLPGALVRVGEALWHRS